MEMLMKAPRQAAHQLVNFWSGYFQETPKCSHPECDAIAVDVDPYFPYLDDLNRCAEHTDPEIDISMPGSVS